jgi:hypothetical protein
MQYLNQNILRPQQPQIDLFGNFDIKKQPQQEAQQQQHQVNTTPKSASNKVIKAKNYLK